MVPSPTASSMNNGRFEETGGNRKENEQRKGKERKPVLIKKRHDGKKRSTFQRQEKKSLYRGKGKKSHQKQSGKKKVESPHGKAGNGVRNQGKPSSSRRGGKED